VRMADVTASGQQRKSRPCGGMSAPPPQQWTSPLRPAHCTVSRAAMISILADLPTPSLASASVTGFDNHPLRALTTIRYGL
jgi:hypothetical protein